MRPAASRDGDSAVRLSPRHWRISVFVVMAFMFGVAVAVVDEVHVVAVLNRDVGAVRTAVLVLGESMFCLDFLGHDVLLRRRRSENGAYLSWLWAMASWMTRAT